MESIQANMNIVVVILAVLILIGCGPRVDSAVLEQHEKACANYAIANGSQSFEFEAPGTCWLHANESSRYSVQTIDIMTGETMQQDWDKTIDMWTQTAP
jgi:hypothetical protein